MQLDQQTLLAIVLGLVCIGAVLFVVLAPSGKQKATKRAATIAGNSKVVRRAAKAHDNTKERRRNIQESLKKLE